jgi:hypothetical protein
MKTMQEVWRWKEEVARETENMSEQEQLAYFHLVSREFLENANPPVQLPLYEASSSLSPK